MDRFYHDLSLQKMHVEDVRIGLRQVGQGPDLVFIHGFPTHGFTWRKVLPELSRHFKCHVLDLPGLGDSEWSNDTNFKSADQAAYVMRLLDRLGLDTYSIIAHDSGATVARVIALEEKEKVKHLIMFNTEMPNHRPPWIPFYQKTGMLPLVPEVLSQLSKQSWFVKSPMGFRQFYSDKTMLQDQNILPYTHSLSSSKRRTIGALKYLRGIDWKLIDRFEQLHQQIEADTLIIWGEDDKTFPVELGRRMLSQFNCRIQFVPIANASLLPHEEKPNEVCRAILEFIQS